MIQYSAILARLKHLGFGDKFMEWIKKMLLYISIILNGIPGTNIACKRGVRQGDPYHIYYL
jgi:hypothetical protein